MTATAREAHDHLLRLADELHAYRQTAADHGTHGGATGEARDELLPVLADTYGALLDLSAEAAA